MGISRMASASGSSEPLVASASVEEWLFMPINVEGAVWTCREASSFSQAKIEFSSEHGKCYMDGAQAQTGIGSATSQRTLEWARRSHRPAPFNDPERATRGCMMKILLISLAGIGDTVLATPFIRE